MDDKETENGSEPADQELEGEKTEKKTDEELEPETLQEVSQAEEALKIEKAKSDDMFRRLQYLKLTLRITEEEWRKRWEMSKDMVMKDCYLIS